MKFVRLLNRLVHDRCRRQCTHYRAPGQTTLSAMSLFLVSITPGTVSNETIEGVNRLGQSTMRGQNPVGSMVMSPSLISDHLLLNWGPGLIRSRDQYLRPYRMVMPQRSGKKDAAETSDATHLLAKGPPFNEQDIADLQASLTDQLQDLRPGGSRNCEVVFGQGLHIAHGRPQQVDVCILRRRLLLLLIQTNWSCKWLL